MSRCEAGRLVHTLPAILRLRMFTFACGYEVKRLTAVRTRTPWGRIGCRRRCSGGDRDRPERAARRCRDTPSFVSMKENEGPSKRNLICKSLADWAGTFYRASVVVAAWTVV